MGQWVSVTVDAEGEPRAYTCWSRDHEDQIGASWLWSSLRRALRLQDPSIGGRVALLKYDRDIKSHPSRSVSRNYFAHDCYLAVLRSTRMHVFWFVHRVRGSVITSGR